MTTDLRKVFRIIGLILTVISCGMSAWFGWQQSPYTLVALGMAVFLGAISIASDFIWPLVSDQRTRMGLSSKWAPSVIAGVSFALFCNVFNLASNFGSVGFTRGEASQQAEMQNIRFDDGRQSVADLEAKKKLLEGRMAKLEATEGWTGMKPSAAFDGEIEAQKLAVDVEASRGGCKTKCLDEKRKLAELEANKAVALAHETDKKMLDATIAALAKVRTEQSTVEKGSNGAKWQNAEFASLFTWSLEPTESAQQWTERWLAWGMAIMLAFGGAGANYYGHWGWGTGTRPSGGGAAEPHAATERAVEANAAALRAKHEEMARPVSLPSSASVPAVQHHHEERVFYVPDGQGAKAAKTIADIQARSALLLSKWSAEGKLAA